MSTPYAKFKDKCPLKRRRKIIALQDTPTGCTLLWMILLLWGRLLYVGCGEAGIKDIPFCPAQHSLVAISEDKGDLGSLSHLRGLQSFSFISLDTWASVWQKMRSEGRKGIMTCFTPALHHRDKVLNLDELKWDFKIWHLAFWSIISELW